MHLYARFDQNIPSGSRVYEHFHYPLTDLYSEYSAHSRVVQFIIECFALEEKQQINQGRLHDIFWLQCRAFQDGGIRKSKIVALHATNSRNNLCFLQLKSYR